MSSSRSIASVVASRVASRPRVRRATVSAYLTTSHRPSDAPARARRRRRRGRASPWTPFRRTRSGSPSRRAPWRIYASNTSRDENVSRGSTADRAIATHRTAPRRAPLDVRSRPHARASNASKSSPRDPRHEDAISRSTRARPPPRRRAPRDAPIRSRAPRVSADAIARVAFNRARAFEYAPLRNLLLREGARLAENGRSRDGRHVSMRARGRVRTRSRADSPRARSRGSRRAIRPDDRSRARMTGVRDA